MNTFILYALMPAGEKFALGGYATEKAATRQYDYLTKPHAEIDGKIPAQVLGIKSFTIEVLTVKRE